MRSVELHIAADHPAYAGHFPGHPVFPGAALIDLVIRTLDAAALINVDEWCLDGAKFQSALAPGEPVTLRHESPRDGLIRFSIVSNERTVATGSLTRREPPR
jgi:3-hydroxymyristoyl/3-hydroxydecanoyl-(acyl carrier protein) dehydratase